MIYAVISDLHANHSALKRVLNDAKRNGAERTVCLGDVVGYGPQPSETISLLRRSSAAVVAGNHDDAVSGRLDPEDFIDLAADAVERHRDQISRDDIAWLRALPYTAEIDGALVTHGDFTDPQAFNYIDSCEAAAENFGSLPACLMFAGHTHTPCIYLTGSSGRTYRLDPQDFAIEEGKRYIVNPGSVGYPRESDGKCESSYVVYDSVKRTVSFRFLPFEVSSVMQRGRTRRSARTWLLTTLAAVAAAALAAVAVVMTRPSPPPPSAPSPAAARDVAERTPAARGIRKTITLPPSASHVRANLVLEKNSPSAATSVTFLNATGERLAGGESRDVKLSFRKALEVPDGAVTAAFEIKPASGGREPRIKSFAPAACTSEK